MIINIGRVRDFTKLALNLVNVSVIASSALVCRSFLKLRVCG